VVKTRSGWFSDRSAVYLAMGKPVIVQDTGARRLLPAGEGMFPFNDANEVVEAVERVNADYDRHCRAARALAEQFFDAGKLLRGLLNEVGL
jgi:glycosyltransferase involved in cell wall biosynthesis